eukprot:3689879-Amphidinium_carterae.1
MKGHCGGNYPPASQRCSKDSSAHFTGSNVDTNPCVFSSPAAICHMICGHRRSRAQHATRIC